MSNCNSENKPKKGEDCYQLQTGSEDKECCYAYIKGINYYGNKLEKNSCISIPKNKSLKECKSYYEEPYKYNKIITYTIEEIQCQGRTYPEDA